MEANSILGKPVNPNSRFNKQMVRIMVYPDVFNNMLLVPDVSRSNGMPAELFNVIIGIPGPQMIYLLSNYTGKLTKAAYKRFKDYHCKIIDTNGKLSCLMVCGFMFVIQKSTVDKAESTLSPVFGRYRAYKKIGYGVFRKTPDIYNVIYSNNFNRNIPISLRNYILKMSQSENETLVFKERPMTESYLNMLPSTDCEKAISAINDIPIYLNDDIMVSKMEKDSVYAEELSHVFDLSNKRNLSNTILPIEE